MNRRKIKKRFKGDCLSIMYLKHIQEWANLPQDGIIKYLIKFCNSFIHGQKAKATVKAEEVL